MAKVSIKHLQIDKSQSTIIATIVITVVVAIFGIFAVRALVIKGLYQRRVLHARRQVVSQLKDNYTAAQSLFTLYKVFEDQDPNILGGSKSGTGNLDGDNARVVLDSLPSKYDAPALAASLEKILTGRNVSIKSVRVTDDSTANSDQSQPAPKPKTVVFSFEANTNFKGASQLLQDFERSIRPFDVSNLEISGTDASLHISADVTTYYQPATSLDLKPTKVVE